MKKVIATKNAPAAIGPYSQAVQVGNMLFASGQLGIDPATGLFVEGSVKEQTAQAFKNVHAILAEAGYSINDVVKTTVFLADMGDFAVMNEVYASQFEGAFPARSAEEWFGRDRGDRRERIIIRNNESSLITCRDYSRYPSRLLP